MEERAEVIRVAEDVRKGRAQYVTPLCEQLGAWRALTLQQSVPILFGNPT